MWRQNSFLFFFFNQLKFHAFWEDWARLRGGEGGCVFSDNTMSYSHGTLLEMHKFTVVFQNITIKLSSYVTIHFLALAWTSNQHRIKIFCQNYNFVYVYQSLKKMSHFFFSSGLHMQLMGCLMPGIPSLKIQSTHVLCTFSNYYMYLIVRWLLSKLRCFWVDLISVMMNGQKTQFISWIIYDAE